MRRNIVEILYLLYRVLIMEKTRKLIYILNHYSNNSSKHFFHVINLLEKIADNGVKIVLIIEKCEEKPKFINQNITVVSQKETQKIKRAIELKNILKKYIEKGYRKIFIRISVFATLIAIQQGKKYGAEVFFWQSGDNLIYDKKKKGFNRVKYYLRSYLVLLYIKNNTSYFVTGPESMINFYKKQLNIEENKMLLLYNDVDCNRFSMCNDIKEKVKLREKLGFDKNEKIILFIHRLTPIKRFDLYLPYVIEKGKVNKLNIKLVIIGDGPDYPKIKKQIESSEVSNSIILLGEIPNKEVMNYYKIADLFINPSYSEGFPRVIIEAMACGLPIIATDVGGTKDIVGKKQREYITDKDNIELLSKNIYILLTNEVLRRELIKENLEFVKRYSTENIAKMYVQKIFEIVGEIK